MRRRRCNGRCGVKHDRGFLLAALLLAACQAEPVATNDGSAVAAATSERPGDAAARRESGNPAPAAQSAEAPAMPAQQKQDAAPKAGACDLQDGSALPPLRLRAVGTEPFWGARIEGRCVTYSHPEDQAGTRVWTKFEGSALAGSWSGALNGQPFKLRTRAQAGCSDGMSDRLYPIEVSLTVGGEERQGCAEPL